MGGKVEKKGSVSAAEEEYDWEPGRWVRGCVFQGGFMRHCQVDEMVDLIFVVLVW